MKHHAPEEWLLYMDGEASSELSDCLSQHLKICPECAAELAAWKRSAWKLRQLKFPAQPRQSQAPVFTAVKWGLAAGIALFIGVAVGRLSAPNADELRQTITAQARVEMRDEMRHQLAALSQLLDQQRKTDERRMIALVNNVRDQNIRDCIALRQDLETAVSVADNDLRVNNRRINEIAVAVSENQK